jgi:von Hippel-Lindau disease tumor supressor
MSKLRYFYSFITISVLLAPAFNANISKANAQSQKCNAESISISRNSKVSTEITFINQRSVPVKTYWLDYSGKRKFYATIAPGDKVVQQTYVTHPWVVTDTSNNCLGLYYPDGQPRLVEIP